MVLQKTVESPLDCKEIQPVHPKGNQSLIFIGMTDAEAETPILWPLGMKDWLIWQDPDAGKDWRQEDKGTTENEMVGWHHWLDGRESQSLFKLMSIESVMLSNHLILCCPLVLLPSIFPSIRVFSNESVIHIRWPKDWGFSFSISTSTQDWFPLGLTGWISLQFKGLSRVFSNTTVQKHQFFIRQPSLRPDSHTHTWLLEKPYHWLDGPLLPE